jgi:large subunit ribosomal protein L25
MEQIVVEAQRRTPGGKNVNRRLRHAGKIPAVVYGTGRQPLALSVEPGAVSDILHSESGRNTIFTLSVDGKKSDVMVKDYQLDPVLGLLIHADLFEVAMDRALEVTVNIEIVGEAEGVTIGGGIMDTVTRSLLVECLPRDIPESIKVDVTSLKINDYIRVKTLQADAKYKILNDPEVVIVTIVPPIKEEVPVEAAPPEAAEPAAETLAAAAVPEPVVETASMVAAPRPVMETAPVTPAMETPMTEKPYVGLAKPKFELYKDKSEKFRFRLKARNGEIIATGEAYNSKEGCLNGIESMKRNAPTAAIVEVEPVVKRVRSTKPRTPRTTRTKKEIGM